MSTPIDGGSPATRPSRILVVDDLPEVCTIFREAHRRMRGVSVQMVTETNSQRALELVEHEAFDLVISDFRMREVDGIEVLTRARETNPRGYRILMTGYNEIPATMQRIRQANVDAYVQKPFHTQDLILMMLGFLSHEPSLLDSTRKHARELETEANVSGMGLDRSTIP